MSEGSRVRHNSEPSLGSSVGNSPNNSSMEKPWLQKFNYSMREDSPLKSSSTSVGNEGSGRFGNGVCPDLNSSAFQSFVKEMPALLPTGGADFPRNSKDKPTVRSTKEILHLYKSCNPKFSYQDYRKPRRILTKPSEPVHNDGHDNENYEYVLRVHETIGDLPGQQYQVIDMLGQGTFGQVVKCRKVKQDGSTEVEANGCEKLYAVKIIKNKPAYFNQSKMEVKVLSKLNILDDESDERIQMLIPELRGDKTRLVNLHDHFIFRNHLCIGFELMSINLFELLKENRFHGLSFSLIRVILRQLLDGLIVLSRSGIIHCDLKPENILLKSRDATDIKIIDFGSACDDTRSLYSYIQSRFYRSPEVLLGMPYDCAIDMWSLGCIAAELCLGLPIFPGTSEYDQLSRILEVLSPPSVEHLSKAKTASAFFNMEYGYNENGNKVCVGASFKPLDQYCREYSVKPKPSKNYFNFNSLKDICKIVFRRPRTSYEMERELDDRNNLVQLLIGLLKVDPSQRWTADQARMHPFIVGKPFDMGWVPDLPNPVVNPHLNFPYTNSSNSPHPYTDASSNMNYHLTNQKSLNFHHSNPYPIPTNRNLDRRNSVSYDYMSKAGISPEIMYLSAQGGIVHRDRPGLNLSPDEPVRNHSGEDNMALHKQFGVQSSVNELNLRKDCTVMGAAHRNSSTMYGGAYHHTPSIDCPPRRGSSNLPGWRQTSWSLNTPSTSMSSGIDDELVAGRAPGERFSRRNSVCFPASASAYGPVGSFPSSSNVDGCSAFGCAPSKTNASGKQIFCRQSSQPNPSSVYYFNPSHQQQQQQQQLQSNIQPSQLPPSSGSRHSYMNNQSTRSTSVDYSSPPTIPEWDPFYMDTYQCRTDHNSQNIPSHAGSAAISGATNHSSLREEGEANFRLRGSFCGHAMSPRQPSMGGHGAFSVGGGGSAGMAFNNTYISPGGYSFSSIDSNTSLFSSGSSKYCAIIRESEEFQCGEYFWDSSCFDSSSTGGVSRDNFNDASFNWEGNIEHLHKTGNAVGSGLLLDQEGGACASKDGKDGRGRKSHLANLFKNGSGLQDRQQQKQEKKHT